MEQDHDPAPSGSTQTVELAPPITKGEQKLTEEERLGIENLFLKMQNCQLQVQAYDNAKAAIIMQMRDLQNEMDEKRRTLSLKYGTDITRTTVKPDGTITGAQAAPSNGA
jgi:hypothetical protein